MWRIRNSGERAAPPIEKAGIGSILIRAVNWLGDAVMTTPAMAAVRASFPEARITLLANPLVAELFSAHGSIDDVMVFDNKGRHTGIAGRVRMARELRARRFDMAILLQNAFDAALLTWLAGIPVRVGYRRDGRGPLLTHGCPVTEATKRLHHVDYYLAMLNGCGIAAVGNDLSLTVTADEIRATAQTLAEAGIDETDFVIGVNPGATYGSAKRWYPDKFAAVAADLAQRWRAKVIITGGPGEAAIAADIAEGLAGHCLNMAGKTGVRDLMSLIRRCDFFVTNDSGPMHIAAAFDVPLVAVFGPTDYTNTRPLSKHAVVVRKDVACAPCLKRECPTDHRCMKGIDPKWVIDTAVRLKETLKS